MTGAELAQMRKAAGLKSKELAAKLGINPTTLSRYECGRLEVTPMLEYAARYACEAQLRASIALAMARLMEAMVV